MVPTLHGTGVPTAGNLGKGKLIDIISAEVFEEINGEYYLTFKYPVTGALYNDLLEGGVVAAAHPLEWGDFSWKYRSQWFDIVSHTTEIDGVVEFRAEHCSRRLSKMFRIGELGESGALWIGNQGISNLFVVPSAVDGMPYTVRLEGTFPTPYETKQVPLKSVLSMLIGAEDSIASVWGQEFAFDASFYKYWAQQSAVGLNLIVLDFNGRGKDRGVSIRRGVNMLSLEHTIDKSNVFNAVVPYWKKADGTFIMAYNGTADSHIVYPTTPISPVIVAALDCTDQFDTEPTTAQLTAYAQEWLDTNQPWLPIDSLSVDFANDIIEGNEEIYIGDTIHVSWPDADISATMRVHSYKFDVLAEKYTELNLGTPQTEYVAVTGDTFAGATGGGSGGGSSGSKTTLWENSATTSNFTAQDVTLSESIENFDFILVGYVFSTSNQNYSSMIVPAAKLWPGERQCDLRVNAGNYNRTGARTFYAKDATTVHFNAASYNTNTANGYVIPEHIIGIKL